MIASLPHSVPGVLLAVALAACGEGGAPVEAEPARWTLGEPTLRIGTLDDGPSALTSVGGLARGPGGRLYVLQPSDAEVRAFAEDGAFVRAIGGEGEGPGEMMRPTAFGFLGDTLWVGDARLRRVTFYDTAGTHVGDWPYPSPPALPESMRASYQGPMDGGRELWTTSPAFQSDLIGTDHPFPLLAVGPDGTVDTLGFTNQAHAQAMLVAGAGGQIASIQIFQQVYSDATLWDVTPDGGVVMVDRAVPDAGADSAAYRLVRTSPAGDTVFDVRVRYEPLPVPRADQDSLVQRYSRGERPESEIRDILFLPPTWPPASDVVAALDGTVWVAREAVPDEPRAWDVFDGEGRRVALTTTPPGMQVHRVEADAVWGVVTDELDVPYVVRLPVRRKGGGAAGG